MDYLYAIAAILAVVAIALLLGWTEAHVKGRAAQAIIWIGGILALLALRLSDSHPLARMAMMSAVISACLRHIPTWAIYAVVTALACFVCWYLFNLFGQAILELSQQVNDLNRKLDRIDSRLPEGDD